LFDHESGDGSIIVYRSGIRHRAHRRESSSNGSRRTAGDFQTLHQARAAYERDFILKTLDQNHGNVSRTAEVLGLERSHLYRKMKTLGIAVKE